MKVKNTVDIYGLQPELVFGMVVVERVFREHGQGLTLTSVCDGKHSFRSLHYKGLAFDCRTRNITRAEQDGIVDEIRARLPKDWDIVLETSHIHVEYDRKR